MSDHAFLRILFSTLASRYQVKELTFASLKTLSDRIRTDSQMQISTNTLARMSGLRRDSRTHFRYSLNQVAVAAGFNSYDHFLSTLRFKSHLSEKLGYDDEFPFVARYARVAVERQDDHYLLALSNYLADQGTTFRWYFEIGHSILLGLRNSSPTIPFLQNLTRSPFFVEFVFEQFIDLDYMDGYYGEVLKLLSSQYDRGVRTRLFADSLLAHHYLMLHGREQLLESGIVIPTMEEIEELYRTGAVFIAARWFAVRFQIALIKRDHLTVELIWGRAQSWFEEESVENAMVMIAQFSAFAALEDSTRLQELVKTFVRLRDQVDSEWDSYAFAGLYLSLAVRKQLINRRQFKLKMQKEPWHFYGCSNTILNLIDQLEYIAKTRVK